MEYCNRNGRAFVFAGGSQQVQNACTAKANIEFPDLAFKCVDIPHSNNPSSLSLERELEKCPDAVVMVGIGALKQERFIHTLVGRFPSAIFVGIGAAGNFYSGINQRAPEFIQNAGLEWLYRLLREPRRLFKRYILDDVPFLIGLYFHLLSAERN
jgi:N-acetylglucosaminyldiphosphoundecaprenol N-acetyl-beta-D-mannosaminyltransferase